MNTAIKYRAYPTGWQSALIAKTFGCCRKIWNLMLNDKITLYNTTGSFGKQTPAQYKDKYPYLKEVDSLALANVQVHLQKAFDNKFVHKHCNFPKYKSKRTSGRSYTTNNQHGTVAIVGNYIRLPKAGLVKAKIHRQPKDNWMIKSATVSQTPDGSYYISLLFEYDEVITPVSKDTGNAIGLDYKSSALYMDSDGNLGTNHKYYKESMERLAKAQHMLKHKKIGSSNYKKQLRRIAKIHAHVANQRNDNLQKTSTAIAKRYDVVCIEDLKISDTLDKHNYRAYHRSAYDNGWYKFTLMLEYKLKARGKYLVKVDKCYSSSQTCSCCGHVNPAVRDDSIRKWQCSSCKAEHDRDVNAAVNIRNEGLRMLKATA